MVWKSGDSSKRNSRRWNLNVLRETANGYLFKTAENLVNSVSEKKLRDSGKLIYLV